MTLFAHRHVPHFPMPKRYVARMEQEMALLTARLEASELRHRVRALEQVVSQLEVQLKESTTLLRKQRLPARIKVTSTQRQQLAARQGWRCAGGDSCPLHLINPPSGLFTAEALFEVDHELPWAESAEHTGNLRCLCAYCHAVATRRQCEQRAAAARFA